MQGKFLKERFFIFPYISYYLFPSLFSCDPRSVLKTVQHFFVNLLVWILVYILLIWQISFSLLFEGYVLHLVYFLKK